MNPDGKVNIKIVRDADDGAITGVAYLTAEEKAPARASQLSSSSSSSSPARMLKKEICLS